MKNHIKVSIVLANLMIFTHFVIVQAKSRPQPVAVTDVGAELQRIRNGILERGESWIATDTPMLHLDLEEFRNLLLPWTALNERGGDIYQPRGYPRDVLHLDWRANGGDFVTGVRSQGDCSCCWDFAATAVMESAFLIATGQGSGREFDLSEQHVLSCLDDFGLPGGCGSGSPRSVFDFASEWGMILESCLPYEGDPSIPCGQFCADIGERLYFYGDQGEVTVLGADVDLIRDALHNLGPLTATMDVYENFRAYGGGIYVASGELLGGHVVTIIGYDDAEEYWIAKNSWGEDWGIDGFFLIAWDSGSHFATSTRWARFDPEGPPRAAMEINPVNPFASETVLFSDRSHPVAPDLGIDLVDWKWDFDGDGQWDADGPGPHTFAFQEAGRYRPRLSVTDSANGAGETEIDLEVGVLGMSLPDPAACVLHAAFPNPFNGQTRIVFDLPTGGGHVRLSIHDLLGRPIRTLEDRELGEGRYSVSWNGCDRSGTRLSSGLYLCRLETGSEQRVSKLVLLQ